MMIQLIYHIRKNYNISLFICFILFGFHKSFAQDAAKDTILYSYSNNDHKIFYTALQTIITGNQPISYFSLVPAFYPVERPLTLRPEEGQAGYLFEGSFDQAYTLFQGRSNSGYFLQTSRFSFRFAPTLRLTLDKYLYLLPTNQKVGGQIDKVLWDNHSSNIVYQKNGKSVAYDDLTAWNRSNRPVKMIYMSITGMHYSNGLMLTKVYLDSAHTRNNYQSGYFSSNYFNAMFYYSYFNKKLLTSGLGYQFDFTGIPEQWNRYGEHRILLMLQSRSRPRTAYFNFIPRMRTLYEKDIVNGKVYTLKRLWEHRIRIESEYILGNLSNFQRSSDYRFCMHFYYEILPLRSRAIGALLHAYYGRDYLNIRYDDIVFGIMGGLTLTFNKYMPPRFSQKDYVVRVVPKD